MEAEYNLQVTLDGEDSLPPQLLATHEQTHESLPRRTKLVFLYSSEDEDDVYSAETRRDGEAAVVTGVVALNPPLDSLQEMQLEAELAAQRQPHDSALLADEAAPQPQLFTEDTAGEEVTPTSTVLSGVKVVEALPLREPDGGCGNARASLRRHLQVEEAGRLAYARKRFRDEGGMDSGRDGEEVDDAAAGSEDAGLTGPQPMVDGDGLVRAIAVGGYQLTVDERQLQSCSGDDEEHAHEGVERGDDGDEVDEEEDEEDEMDEELDEAVVVAVVEQLVRCCESDELDASLRESGERFLLKARSCLQRLNAGELEPATFGEEMRGDILCLLRAVQRLRRPKDSPIVIDGVVMDI
ncbi:hypothetical protein TraAM80_04249 [Trypanosoma rangeli]|uniref:Uncharacterized protein n=1 Tax=Trypanosoma rangeli TaxID=5698 RepID=A0A422NKL4_TRYRA|nr:uncharacterized protein TraAM80_04249 [Trypanosoma rangeli]RNF06001.1 hypothetical protein TraAM80_04249 [Trypanosoma rangeli]|eukprot:RNF06001.1 hypothetical protein TraAM80_04249 [Trypanosoma rangeli]